MKKEIKEISQCVRELTITIDSETALKDYNSIIKSFKHMVAVPGFRKGKAPLAMIDKLYGSHAREEYLSKKLPEYYSEALNDDEINPLTQGEPTKVDWEKGKDLVATFKFEVKPIIEIKKYKDLEIPFEAKELPTEAVDASIEEIRTKMGNIDVVDEAVASNDHVKLSMQLPDPEAEGKYKEPFEREIIVDQNHYSKELNEKVIGKKAGDEFEAVMFDNKEEENNFAGKTVKIKVVEVKRNFLPELNDEFAKDAEYESLDEMKAKVKEELEKKLGFENQNGLKDAMTSKLIEENPFDVPPSIVKNYAMNMAQQFAQAYKMPAEQIAPAYEKIAEVEIKKYYIVNELKQIEKIDVSEDDKEAMIAELAGNMNLTPEEYKERYKTYVEGDDLTGVIEEKKIFDLVEASSKIVPLPVPEPKEEAKEVKEDNTEE